MAKIKTKAGKTETEPLSVRLPVGEIDRLDDLVKRYPFVSTRNNLAKIALQLGVNLIVADPNVLLNPDNPPRKKS